MTSLILNGKGEEVNAGCPFFVIRILSIQEVIGRTGVTTGAVKKPKD